MIEFFAQVQSRKTTGCGWLRRHNMDVFFFVGAHLYRVFFLFCPESRTRSESLQCGVPETAITSQVTQNPGVWVAAAPSHGCNKAA